MRYLKTVGLAAIAASALMALGAGSASATTLELGAAVQNQSVAFTASLRAGTAISGKSTGGIPLNACTESHMAGATAEPYSNSGVGGPLTALSFGKCSKEPIEVVNPGSLNIEHIASTTNGTVRSVGAEIKVPSGLGALVCKTGTGTDIGTLTGNGAGHATLDINAVLNCGIVASALWVGEYTITTPTNLGVVA